VQTVDFKIMCDCVTGFPIPFSYVCAARNTPPQQLIELSYVGVEKSSHTSHTSHTRRWEVQNRVTGFKPCDSNESHAHPQVVLQRSHTEVSPRLSGVAPTTFAILPLLDGAEPAV
jgi:hypothetical protein